MSHTRTGRRILLGFAALMAVAFAGAAVLLTSLLALSRPVESISEREFPASRALADIDRGLHAATRGMNGILSDRILSDPEMRDAAFRMAEDGPSGVESARKRLDALALHPEDRETWRAVSTGLDRWSGAVRPFVEAARDRERLAHAGTAVSEVDERAWARYREVRAAYVAVAAPLAELQRGIDRDVDALRAAATQAARRGLLLGVVTALLAMIVNCVIVIRLVRGVDRSLDRAQEEATRLRDAVARGELAVRADPASVEPDFRPLLDGMNATVEAAAAPIRTTADALARIARGDPPPPLADAYHGDFDLIRRSVNTCIETVAALEQDARGLVDAAVAGRLDHRADASRHHGAFARLVGGMNTLVQTLVAHLDAMPAPAFIVDRDLRLQYLNAAAARASGATLATARGRRCAEIFRADDCGTERCACARAMRDGRTASSETIVRCGAGALEIAYSGVPVRDGDGRVVGAFEVISDQTEVRRAARASAKLSEYQGAEARRLVEALGKLSRGELDLDVRVADADADAAGARAQFEAIATALRASADAVARVVHDADALANAALGGDLSSRADASKHSGDFRKIVDGMNRTIDAVVAPVDEATRALERMADRDLRARVNGTYRGDHARIQEAVNGTAASLAGALGQVADAAQQVRSAAAQIASSSQAVASGASEQAASLEETGAVLDTVSGSSKQAADSAHQANVLAQSASTAAQDGASAVEQLQAAMGQIKASAEGTSQIIKDVSEIAFQTNLLALNAAVEAARAGEAGRGFAVVAEEVRSLALRAKEAAQKTEELIRASVKQAQEGEASAARVAGKLTEIHGAVGKVTDIVAEISATAKEQAQGVVEVTRAVSEMDKVTQQNAASAEESSSTASELSSQADELASLVGTFQLDRDGAARGARPRPAAPVAAPARPAPARPSPRRSAAPPAPPAACAKPSGAANGKANGKAHDPFPMDDDVILKDF